MGRPRRRISRHKGGARQAPRFLFGIVLLIGLGLLAGARTAAAVADGRTLGIDPGNAPIVRAVERTARD